MAAGAVAVVGVTSAHELLDHGRRGHLGRLQAAQECVVDELAGGRRGAGDRGAARQERSSGHAPAGWLAALVTSGVGRLDVVGHLLLPVCARTSHGEATAAVWRSLARVGPDAPFQARGGRRVSASAHGAVSVRKRRPMVFPWYGPPTVAPWRRSARGLEQGHPDGPHARQRRHRWQPRRGRSRPTRARRLDFSQVRQGNRRRQTLAAAGAEASRRSVTRTSGRCARERTGRRLAPRPRKPPCPTATRPPPRRRRRRRRPCAGRRGWGRRGRCAAWRRSP